MQNMVNIQTYKHISQKRIPGAVVRCSEGNRSVLSDVIGREYFTAIHYRNIPAFHIS